MLGEEHNPINGVDLPEILSGLHSNSVEVVYRMKKKTLSHTDTLILGNEFHCSDSSGIEFQRYQTAVRLSELLTDSGKCNLLSDRHPCYFKHYTPTAGL